MRIGYRHRIGHWLFKAHSKASNNAPSLPERHTYGRRHTIRLLPLIVCLVLLASELSAQKTGVQSKRIIDPVRKGSDLSFDFDSYYFGLPPVRLTHRGTHIRIRIRSHVIDLYSPDDHSYTGSVITYLSEMRTVKGSA